MALNISPLQVEGAARDLKGQAKGAFKDAKGEAKGAMQPYSVCTPVSALSSVLTLGWRLALQLIVMKILAVDMILLLRDQMISFLCRSVQGCQEQLLERESFLTV